MSKYPDISHHHPIKDWGKVKAACPFLISKATQGTSYTDPTLESFIKGCEANKIPYWLYTYLNKGNEKAQAEYMAKTCGSKVGKYFVGHILDVEAGNKACDVKATLDYLNGLGVKTMIYTMYAEYSTYKSVISGRGSNCAWWEARYGKNDGTYSSKYPPHSGADLHQYTDAGSCAGINGKVDLNRLTGTKKESWFATPIKTNNDSNSQSESAKPTLRYGDTGSYVKSAQTILKKKGFYTGSIDGIFKQKTLDGTKAFQKSRGLKVDGFIGSKTWAELEKGDKVSVKTYSLKKDGDKALSDNFRVREFKCNDGSDKILIDVNFVKNYLQKIRDHFKVPVTINSAYRTSSYNKKVGGASGSYHLKGQAFDIVVKGHTPLEVAKYASTLGIKGIIQYNSFVHVDSRPKKYWARNNNGKVTVKNSF